MTFFSREMEARNQNFVNIPTHEEIEDARSSYRDTPEDIQTFRDYTKGKTDLELTDKMKLILKGTIGHEFSDNVCKQIVSESVGRLLFTGWECENPQVSEFLDDLFKTQRILDRQGSIHFDCLRDGNYAVAVDWDSTRETVRIYREKWWDGKDGIFLGYDETDSLKYAVKDWHTFLSRENGNPALVSNRNISNLPSSFSSSSSLSSSPSRTQFDEVIRRNIWTDDLLIRWVSRDGGSTWEPFTLPTDTTPDGIVRWPLPWIKNDGSPLHIPIVHFSNAGHTEDLYGLSELDGGVIAFQDHINDTHYALAGASRLTAFQMIWMTGITPDDDTEVGAGVQLSAENPDARFGVLEAGDLTQLLSRLDKLLERVAQMTLTPAHIIKGGNWPSGEALIRAEQPAIDKATRQIHRFKDAWSAIGHKATEIHNRFSSGPQLNEDVKGAMISAVYSSPERRDPLSKSLVVQQLGDRISDAEALRIMGYSQEQADMIMKEKERESQLAAKQLARNNEIIGQNQPEQPGQFGARNRGANRNG